MTKEREGRQTYAKQRYLSHSIVQPSWNASGRLLRGNYSGVNKYFNFSEIFFIVYYFLHYVLPALCQVEDGDLKEVVIWRCLTSEARVRYQSSVCRIYVAQGEVLSYYSDTSANEGNSFRNNIP